MVGGGLGHSHLLVKGHLVSVLRLVEIIWLCSGSLGFESLSDKTFSIVFVVHKRQFVILKQVGKLCTPPL